MDSEGERRVPQRQIRNDHGREAAKAERFNIRARRCQEQSGTGGCQLCGTRICCRLDQEGNGAPTPMLTKNATGVFSSELGN